MKQKVITATLLIIIIGLMASVVIGSKNKTNTTVDNPEKIENQITNENIQADGTPSVILYWGTTCPHCHDTIDWIEENKVEEKISITRKEVYENQQNSIDLAQKAEICGIDKNFIGVPLLFTVEGECLVGTPDIINYLKNK